MNHLLRDLATATGTALLLALIWVATLHLTDDPTLIFMAGTTAGILMAEINPP